MVEPEPRGRAPEQVIPLREPPPDRARVLLHRPAIGARHPKILERDALRVQHPEDVVVGRHEEPRGVRKGRILGEPARVGVAVRADDRKPLHRAVEQAGDLARAPLDREEPVLVQKRHAAPPLAQGAGPAPVRWYASGQSRSIRETAMTQNRVVAIGECMVEMGPAAEPGLFRMGFAGDTFNTAWYLRRRLPAAWQVDYLSAIGTDGISATMAKFMEDAGIGTDHLARLPDATVGLYLIELKNGERSFAYWRGQSAARRLAEDDARLRAALSGASLAYLSGITLAILAAPRPRPPPRAPSPTTARKAAASPSTRTSASASGPPPPR